MKIETKIINLSIKEKNKKLLEVIQKDGKQKTEQEIKKIKERRLRLKISYKVKYLKKAEKFMKKNKDFGKKFFKNFSELSEDFYNNFQNFDIEYYRSIPNSFRMRIGKYRALFTVEDEIRIIEVIEINSRGDIY